MRLLFITASRIGDAVLSSGLLAELARRHPGAAITVACGAACADLFRPMPFVAEVIPMVKRKRAGHWVDLWRRTVGRRWGLVVDLRGSAIAWALPTLRRRILRSSWAPRHRLFHLASVLGEGDGAPESGVPPFPPRLWATPSGRAAAERLIPAGGPVLAVGPAANWGGKQWPAERFSEVAARLTAPGGILPGARVAVFAAPAERAQAASVLAALPAGRGIDLAQGGDLGTAYACLERCAFYLGNDSGLMHMAAAAGIPTLGLFGPSSELFYGPVGACTASVRGPRSFEDICHAPDFDHRSGASLMTDLTPAAVEAAARALWARRPTA